MMIIEKSPRHIKIGNVLVRNKLYLTVMQKKEKFPKSNFQN